MATPNRPVFQQVSPQQPIHIYADEFNAMLQAGMAERMRGTTYGGPAHERLPSFGSEILIQNTTGSTVGQFCPLGISEPVFLAYDNEPEFRQRVIFKGVTPDHVHRGGRFAITLEPIPAGGIGKAIIDGVVPVKIVFPVGSSKFLFADVAPSGVASLAAGVDGPAKILWRETTDEDVTEWAIVRLASARYKAAASAYHDSSAISLSGSFTSIITGGLDSKVSPYGSEEIKYGTGPAGLVVPDDGLYWWELDATFKGNADRIGIPTSVAGSVTPGGTFDGISDLNSALATLNSKVPTPVKIETRVQAVGSGTSLLDQRKITLWTTDTEDGESVLSLAGFFFAERGVKFTAESKMTLGNWATCTKSTFSLTHLGWR